MKLLKKFRFIIAIALIISLLPINVLAAEIPFNDVAPDAWYYQDLKKAVDMGLINGRTPTTFVPDGNILYAEAVKLAACMKNLQLEILL